MIVKHNSSSGGHIGGWCGDGVIGDRGGGDSDNCDRSNVSGGGGAVGGSYGSYGSGGCDDSVATMVVVIYGGKDGGDNNCDGSGGGQWENEEVVVVGEDEVVMVAELVKVVADVEVVVSGKKITKQGSGDRSGTGGIDLLRMGQNKLSNSDKMVNEFYYTCRIKLLKTTNEKLNTVFKVVRSNLTYIHWRIRDMILLSPRKLQS